ncbi:MAG: hypothetical protein JXR18_14055 [Neptuniibacter sp.]
MSDMSLRSVFIHNRAEQLPDDVWDEFVVPVHFNKLDLGNDVKSVLIEGGRGCGKTMFIRYYCHDTLFSPKRSEIPDEELSHVGIYWKPDVKLCAFLEKPGWIPDELKERAFQHLVALSILRDFCNALESIEQARFKNGSISLLSFPVREDIALYFEGKVKTLGDIKRYLATEQVKFDIWSKNPDFNQPLFLQFDEMLEKLIESIAESSVRLKNLFFRIFVDEFENLTTPQQRLLNDHIKQPGRFFSLNIATRRNSNIVSETSGFERVVGTHDYRKVDLEQEFLDQSGRRSFGVLAAEILLLRLKHAGFEFDDAPDLTVLQDRDRVKERRDHNYQNSVMDVARKILPKISSGDISATVFEDGPLKKRLEKLIEKGLKKHNAQRNYTTANFMLKEAPEASIVAACILNRDKNKPQAVLNELMLASSGKKSKFDISGDWVGTNLYGALFYLYSGLPKRPCLLYSGFDRFCNLARSNLRYFQELCHESLTIYESDYPDRIELGKIFSIPPVLQAEAAKITSEKLLIGAGDFGWDLLHLVRRLGKLFQLAHKRPTQSEPEVNHFSITGSFPVEHRERINNLFERAKVWSVLYEGQDTKSKGPNSIELADYFPNPIYAPYFGISYRKIRKITFTAEEFLSILDDDDHPFDEVVKKYEKKWGLNEDQMGQGELGL